MILLELLMGFLRVGLFAFGGAYGAIPLIRDVVLSYGWLTEESLMGMIAVSESTPGPIMVNLATYIGHSQAGVPGAVLATMAVVLPSFIIILLVMTALNRLMKHRFMQAALSGLKPCMVGIVLATGVYMTLNNCIALSPESSFEFPSLLITVLLSAVMFVSKRLFHKKVSPIVLMVLAAGLGMLIA